MSFSKGGSGIIGYVPSIDTVTHHDNSPASHKLQLGNWLAHDAEQRQVIGRVAIRRDRLVVVSVAQFSSVTRSHALSREHDAPSSSGGIGDKDLKRGYRSVLRVRLCEGARTPGSE